MKKLIFTLLFLLTGPAFASGVVTIEGRMTSNTKTNCALETKEQVYTIAKKSLTAAQLGELKANKKTIALQVPFEAIERVQNKK